MTIQWFPGHMHKARTEMAKTMGEIDLVIEVLDARIPYSSENPFAATLRGERPLVKVLNKIDLADPAVVADWKTALEEDSGVKVVEVSGIDPQSCNSIAPLCKRLVSNRAKNKEDVRALITGIPNVGKSTLINALAKRTVAVARNEPAVTQRQQRVDLKNGVVLIDTPGILWPRFDNQLSGYRLAVTGAIRQTAMDFEDVALFAAEYMLTAYPEGLRARYKIDELPDDGNGFLNALARHRGLIRKKGKADLHKASEVFLNELRSGKLGRLCLETPQMAALEKIKTAAWLEEREAKQKERKKKKKRTKKVFDPLR